VDKVTGTFLEFEMEKLVGNFQALTKNAIGKKDFKDKNDDIRVIVLSACQSQRIG
jgi:CHAT domain-containing protein